MRGCVAARQAEGTGALPREALVATQGSEVQRRMLCNAAPLWPVPSLTHGVPAPTQKCLLVIPSYGESPEALVVGLPTPLSEAEQYL